MRKDISEMTKWDEIGEENISCIKIGNEINESHFNGIATVAAYNPG